MCGVEGIILIQHAAQAVRDMISLSLIYFVLFFHCDYNII